MSNNINDSTLGKIENNNLVALKLQTEIVVGEETKEIDYTPEAMDVWDVIVKDQSDWQEIHDYITNENDIDNIPNRKIDCANEQPFSLRTAVYSMSKEEADILRDHAKVEAVELNHEKYPQPQSLCTRRFKKLVAFPKPQMTGGAGTDPDMSDTSYTNDIRGNWSHKFIENPTSAPWKGVGITSTSNIDSDISYSLTGRNVDAIVIDSGVSFLHPEFRLDDGTTRVKDLILDGPYKVDKEYFDNLGVTYTKVVDGVDCGVGIQTASALAWWSSTGNRSAKFASIGSVTINGAYDIPHVATKTTNGDNNQLIDGHGTACAGQIGGKHFGLAKDCNIWNIRLALGSVGGLLDSSTALNACTIWHKAKKLISDDPDPTITNNSYGYTYGTGNVSGQLHNISYRGINQSYTGSGSDLTIPANSGGCRNHKYYVYTTSAGSYYGAYSGSGQYTPVNGGSTTNTAAENAIAAGVIVVAAAGNQNQKMCDKDDIDYDNWYWTAGNYVHRTGGVQKGHSVAEYPNQGTIRVGALDCCVEPTGEKQGSPAFSIRRVVYSNNGSMVDIYAPSEKSMSAGYTVNYEAFARNDSGDFGGGWYDCFFNGTSSACPNTVSLLCLYLQGHRKANHDDCRQWLWKHGSKEIAMSDPYPDPLNASYWSRGFDSSTDLPSKIGECYNLRGGSNLRGSVPRVLYNPFANDGVRKVKRVKMSGVKVKNI